ncbi:SDR family NAD(P)-dependent oxidoreductase [Parapedobacter deserti]|uniref:SDR family NAD(P)-dependent oxidoreductase n=1 Tax=Parapedobacter deserti TaxID=1912957 RepID=A0ABV7JN28_9SPHI
MEHRQQSGTLVGKVAFVTGGSRGMGAAIVKRLAAEGAAVAFTHSGNRTDSATAVVSEVEEAGGYAEAIVADNRNARDLSLAIEQVADRYGKIDILVNNAGIFLYKGTQESSLEEFDELVDVNIRAVFIAMRDASRLMPAGGRIITIGSNVADRVTDGNMGLYGMSKSALIGLTKGMAREMGPHNITVNLVQPGPVDTEMNPADSEMACETVGAMAISRYGTTGEIAGLVAYLASEESQFITGTAITIDGGYNS